MEYLVIPQEVSSHDVRDKEYSFSPRSYRRVEIPNSNTKRVGDLLADYIQGVEVGSLAYLEKSPCNFVRTKALQPWANLSEQKGGSIVALHPKAFAKAVAQKPKREIKNGDMLYARGGSVGEIALAEECGKAITSGHILKLEWKSDPLYCYAFMKHEICKAQQVSALKGSIQALDNFKISTLLDCKIPFPNQSDAPRVITYVSALMQAIIEKEKAIRERSSAILTAIELELDSGLTQPFVFKNPRIEEIRRVGRLDAALYSERYKRVLHSIEKYKHGSTHPENDGFIVTPGPSLEIKLLRVRVDADNPRPGFYSLILPTNISEYGTLNKIQYLGTPKELPLLQNGDILFGESGCHRSLVLIETTERCTTNAHGLYARRTDGNLTKSIFLRCFYDWLDKGGIIDLLSVGGSGGHFSPEYFSSLPIPKFPDEVQGAIAALYHNPTPAPATPPTLEHFVQWHRDWNANLGIWELDREMKALQETLREVQDQIIRGQSVIVPFA